MRGKVWQIIAFNVLSDIEQLFHLGPVQGLFHRFFLTYLLRYNSHTRKLTHLKYSIQWFLIYPRYLLT